MSETTSVSSSVANLSTVSDVEMDRPVSASGRLWRGVRSRSRSLSKRRHDELSAGSGEETTAKVVATCEFGGARGRGRPLSTGRCVGVVTRRALKEAEKKEAAQVQSEAQLAVAATSSQREVEAAPVQPDQEDNSSVEALLRRVTAACASLQNVGRKSKGLDNIKEVTASILDAVSELAAHTASETRRLQVANARLRAEVEDMCGEVMALREELRRAAPDAAAASAAPPPAPSGDDISRAIMVQVGTMVNARMEALESRLPPEPRLRPPLAVDRAPAVGAPGGAPRAAAARGRAPVRMPPPLRIATPRAVAPARAPAPRAGTTRIPVYARPLAASARPVARPPPVVRPRGPAAGASVTTAPAAGPTVETAVPAQSAEVPTALAVPVAAAADAASTARRSRRRGGRRNRKSLAAQRAPDAEVARGAPPTPPAGDGGGWTVVGARRPPPSAPAAAPEAARRLRPARSSAVVLTISPAAAERGVTYAEVISAARERIDLAALEITQLRFRQAATGARILEVPGAVANSAAKADALARELVGVLGTEAVRVTRPVQTAELRLYGLDDSVTGPQVAAAVAATGECDAGAVSVGEIRRGSSGLGAVWVRCPAPAARKLCAAGRLRVGWAVARVELLEARPLRCYRCLVPGHTQALCPLDVDRSQQCYRCGADGHKAATCAAAPRCSVCLAAGRGADHRGGGPACPAPPVRGRQPGAPPAAPPPARSASPPAAAGGTPAGDGDMVVDN